MLSPGRTPQMADCTPVKAPLSTGFKSFPATDEELADLCHGEYPAMVGSIVYASESPITRPDIARAVGVLARTTSNWNKTQGYEAGDLRSTAVAHLNSASPLVAGATSGKGLFLDMRTAEAVSTLGAPPQSTFPQIWGSCGYEVETTSYNSSVSSWNTPSWCSCRTLSPF
jgi:hypothetical protein